MIFGQGIFALDGFASPTAEARILWTEVCPSDSVWTKIPRDDTGNEEVKGCEDVN